MEIAPRELRWESRPIGGVPFAICKYSEVVEWIVHDLIPAREGVNIRLANAYNVALASKDRRYASLLVDAGINFPDGVPVVWALRGIYGQTRAEQVRGPSLFIDVLKVGQSASIRHYMLGSSTDTLTLMKNRIAKFAPSALIDGSYSPPFSEIDDSYIEDCVQMIRRSKAQVVWVGLGTPKQDYVGTALAERLNLTVINVGAAFDFAAGTIKEAPQWLRGSGFEWAYRLVREPRRLWRRYLLGNIRFVRAVATSLLTQRRGCR